MIQLRPYQSEAIDATLRYLAENDGNPLIVLPTGTGKSIVIAEFCRQILSNWSDVKIVVITHVRELIKQNYDELKNLWPEAPAGINSAGLNKRDYDPPIVFCGIQSVYKKASRFTKVDLVLVDECFTKDTIIDTPSGPKTIDLVRCGDLVYSSTGIGTVEAVSVKPAYDLIQVELDDGTITTCTENHPFFTQNGWIPAGKLEIGESLFSIQGLHLLWEKVYSMDQERRDGKSNCSDEGRSLEQAKVLLNILLKEVCESNEQEPSKNKNEGKVKGDKTQTYQERRERAIAAFASASSSSRAWRGMGSGVCFTNKNSEGERISNRVQVGHSQSVNQDSDRNRRPESWLFGKESAGYEEDRISYFPRVVRVSTVKRESAVPVFNLQVSGHPSYFANGKLVHNCHLIPRKSSTMYQKFLKNLKIMNPHVRVIGLTATPYRLDSGLLHTGNEALFDGISYEADLKDMVNQGYLTKLVSKQPKTQLDVTNVRLRGGEFIPGELEKAVNKLDINEAVVQEIVTYGADRKSWLIFCSGVDHASNVANIIRRHGISCETIFGDTPDTERDRIVSEFKQGKIRALASMGVLTTGFNAPAVDLLALLRPTQSTGLYIQIMGRGMRNHPDKSDCLVLDFAGNVARHGPVDRVNPKKPRKSDGEGVAPTKTCPQCKSIVFAGVAECMDCGYVWPPKAPEIQKTATTLPVMSMNAPSEWIKVNYVAYRLHKKPGSPDSMRVEYRSGLTVYREWVCFDHKGYPKDKAMKWWRQRMSGPGMLPTSTMDALAKVNLLMKPTEIKVQKNGKYTEITKFRFVSDMPQGGAGVHLRSPTEKQSPQGTLLLNEVHG